MVNLESRKLGDFLGAAVGLFILINVNLVFSKLNPSIDLTGDKRYTLSGPVIQLLKDLDDVVYIDVYLRGDFPPGFERLENSTIDILNEFKSVAGSNIQFDFIDPEYFRGTSGLKDIAEYLGGLGIQPTNLYASEKGKRTEKLIFPGAVISFGGRESGVMLLKGNKSASPQEQLNQSIEGLEYEFATAISKLVDIEKRQIGLIRGHGELEMDLMESAVSMLNENFEVFPVNLPARPTLIGFDVVIMAKPSRTIPEQDIYKIDQYIMNGGKVIFMIDALHIDEDSIGNGGTIAYPFSSNLDNLLFKYGARVNKDLVLDLNAGVFPVVTGNLGNSPNFQLLPWPYFPVLNHFGEHPIVHNIDAVYTRYISSIDTVEASGVTKIPLIYSSPYTRKIPSPVRVSLNDLKAEMDPKIFNQGQVMVSCLLEGNFSSVFKNRYLPDGVDEENFRDNGVPAKIIILSDGDFPRNFKNSSTGADYELGYDPWLKKTFANKDFILNAVSYLSDDQGIIVSRSRQVTFRPLDNVKIGKEKTLWQAINILLPVMMVILFGYSRHLVRKRKFNKPS
ncbi:MAG TPA: gliding motility-associated ABC transporter substrate-binding protein GldG [Cyclobacteriaceae bacterium]|nr:gliding motility-associated ABC transporter substrate-binding protein GldG [Cyclobacteriaceae bacterium]